MLIARRGVQALLSVAAGGMGSKPSACWQPAAGHQTAEAKSGDAPTGLRGVLLHAHLHNAPPHVLIQRHDCVIPAHQISNV